MSQVLSEMIHLIDAGEDYEKTLEALSIRFSVSKQWLEQAYSDYVMSL